MGKQKKKKSSKCKTDSFVVTLRLMPSAEQADALHTLMNIYCHIQNVVVKHAMNCIKNLERDSTYRRLKENYKKEKQYTTAEKNLINSLLNKYGLNKYRFYNYSVKQNQLFGKQVNSHLVYAMAARAWESVDRYLFKKGKEIHFKKRVEFNSFEGTDHTTGILYKDEMIHINKMRIPVYIRKNDIFAKDALENHRVKYCRILRKRHGQTMRYYVQIVLEGQSPKEQQKGVGRVGIDIGPSTIAVCSDKKVMLHELAARVTSIERNVYLLNRKIDRQRRANNPENYNEDGTIKKDTKSFHKKWKKSKTQQRTEWKRKTLYEKRKNQINYAHNVLAKEILSLGDVFIIEDMQFQALAKRTKETKISEKTGKYIKKKRFGKSIQNHAPSKLIELLETKANRCGAYVVKVDCFKTAATQFDHTSGAFYKHELKERMVNLDNGDILQRDLHSAFNLRHIVIKENEKGEDIYSYDIEQMFNTYDRFKQQHDIFISELQHQKKNGLKVHSSII